jgi:diguanylate cyclase (GGDEF)-like protein
MDAVGGRRAFHRFGLTHQSAYDIRRDRRKGSCAVAPAADTPWYPMDSEKQGPQDLEARFWLRSVAIGGWASLVAGTAGLAYVFVFAGEDRQSNQLMIGLALGLVMALGAAALWVVPWRRVVRSRRRELLLLGWALLSVAAIAFMGAFDGGARSPLALALVLPAVFASLAFSRLRVLLVGLATEAALGVLVAIGSPGAGTVVVAAAVLGAVIAMAGRQADFHQEWRRQLSHHSRTDPLTGLLNRRGFAVASALAFDGRRRGRARVTLVLIDLDLFKDYNDVYGHAAGDDLLRWIGAELGATVRPGDSVARLGGDEFAVLLPETDGDAAVSLVERIGARLSSRVPHCLGVATSPADGEDFDALYKVADAALYARKFARGDGRAGVAAL